MNTEKNKNKWVEKVQDTLKLGGRSEKTIDNYKSALYRFLNYYNENINIKKLNEEDITDYIKKEFINKNRASDTYNLNICAIRYLYSVVFDKDLNKKKLPNVKTKKTIPKIITTKEFITIFNNEKNLEHKCWLLLGFCSGLRVDEVATLRIENIFPKEHKLKVLGKGNKERYTFLPDVTIKFLWMYYKHQNISKTKGYLFKNIETSKLNHLNSKTIINYFSLKMKEIDKLGIYSFHTLRHSFATYYLMSGGNVLTLKSMLGHASLSTTSIYIHIAQNFNNLEGVKYV